MAIAIKSVTTGVNNGGTATVSVTTSETPTVTASGDLVVVFHSNDFYGLANMVAPVATGTPAMNAIGTSDNGANEVHLKGWWYVTNTGGAQTISSTETGTHDEEKGIVAVVLGGADTSTPVDGTVGEAHNASAVDPIVVAAAVPGTTDAFLIVSIACNANNTYTTPSPLAEQTEYAQNPLTGVVATNQLSASGSTGTFSFTPSTSSQFTSLTVAIKTASGGGTPATVTLLPAQANVTIHP